MKLSVITLIVTVAMPCISVRSQTTDTSGFLRDYKRIGATLFSPGKKSSLVSAVTSLNLTSTFEDNEATGTVGYTSNKGTSFSLYVSQSFEEKPKKVTPVNLDGLQANTGFEFSLQQIFWNPEARNMSAFNETKRNFALRKAKLITASTPTEQLLRIKENIGDELFKAKVDTIIGVLIKENCCDREIQTYLVEESVKRRIIEEVNEYVLRDIGLMDLDSQAKSELSESDFAIKWKNPVLIGVSVALGRVDYDYIVDSFSTAIESIKGTNRVFRFSVGTYINRKNIIALSYIYEKKFSPNDPVNYSFPIGTLGQTFNKDVIIERPVKKNDTRLKLEYRSNFYYSGTPFLAINPSVSYYTGKEEFAFEIPFYFLNYKAEDQVKGLQGGISLGLISRKAKNLRADQKKNEFAVSVFVSAPFDMMGLFKTR